MRRQTTKSRGWHSQLAGERPERIGTTPEVDVWSIRVPGCQAETLVGPARLLGPARRALAGPLGKCAGDRQQRARATCKSLRSGVFPTPCRGNPATGLRRAARWVLAGAGSVVKFVHIRFCEVLWEGLKGVNSTGEKPPKRCFRSSASVYRKCAGVSRLQDETPTGMDFSRVVRWGFGGIAVRSVPRLSVAGRGE